MSIIGVEHKVTMWLCISIQHADFMDQINIYYNLKSEKINFEFTFFFIICFNS
jgi:hypothetical protein